MRVLLLANEALGSPKVVEAVARWAEPATSDVLLVAPAPASRGLLATTGGAARKRAKRRIRHTLDTLSGLGISARGRLGAPEPLEAMVSASRTFSPEEIILTTYPPQQSEWSVEGLITSAQRQVEAPIHHVIVPPPEPTGRAPASAARVIRLYHFAEPNDAPRLRSEGFAGIEEDPAVVGGVWMIASRAGRRPEGRVAFAMDVPLDAVKRYEREPGFHEERRFFIPAAILSRLGPLAPLDDQS